MTPIATQTIFYTIERSIKEYRRFAQRNLNKELNNITIDQALVLTFLDEQPELSQNEIADLIFKDNASITRMIDLMTKNGYLKRSVDSKDRRKHILKLTQEGNDRLKVINTIISSNRKSSLKGISREELEQLEQILNKVIINCNN
jgi:DNA-binding MarR family transcriptional regulator